MVDISHVSDKTFNDVLEISRAPVIASHSSMRAIANHPRNMTDDMLRRLASQGGVVQITYHTEFLSQPLLDAERALGEAFEDLDRQVEAKCGEDELCVVTEWSGSARSSPLKASCPSRRGSRSSSTSTTR